MAKVMIEAAINGNAMRDSNPHIAYSPREIAEDAIAACRAGAALIHPHVRDPISGEWSHEVAYYAEVFRRVREHCGALLFPTLPPAKDARKRYGHFVELSKDPASKPDLGALDMGSLNYLSWNAATRTLRSGLYENSVEHLRDALALLKECGIKRSTLQVFDATFLRTILLFLEQGILTEPLMIKFYFGGPELPMGLPPTLKSLEAYLDLLKGVRCNWFVATLGGDVMPMAPIAVAMGGHVRVGLEDYQYTRDGQFSNAQIGGASRCDNRRHGPSGREPPKRRAGCSKSDTEKRGTGFQPVMVSWPDQHGRTDLNCSLQSCRSLEVARRTGRTSQALD